MNTQNVQISSQSYNSESPANDIRDFSKASPSKILELGPNGRYAKLNTILGRGAYKIVYKAIDREEGLELAWNSLQRTSPAEYQEFAQEVEILKKVRHPNIIAFHDFWYNNNNEFIFITELMTSGTLREYIHVLQTPSLKVVKRWTHQILKGLVYLHSQNPPIIHRDIKCDNILVNGAHGEIKIGDMGTAKMKLGKRYTVIGTPEFMAPEMYDENGYNEKVDVYALGMCLIEMVTGEYPYHECTNAAQVFKKVSQKHKPDSLLKITNLEILDLINNCIAQESERYTTDQIYGHPFLAYDPEVVLQSINGPVLVLQVVFRGTEKLSVKFEFNKEEDTAEEVVNEMIVEKVLPDSYRNLIKMEINRILRDLSKRTVEQSSSFNSSYESYRFEKCVKSELEDAKKRLEMAKEKLTLAENKAIISEQRALAAEEKSKTQEFRSNDFYDQEIKLQNESLLNIELPVSDILTELNPGENEHTENKEISDLKPQTDNGMTTYVFGDETPVEEFVKHVVKITNRGSEKEKEWVTKLKEQDILSFGDLKKLHDEDWGNLGLTVFASRALMTTLKENISAMNKDLSNINLKASITATSSADKNLNP